MEFVKKAKILMEKISIFCDVGAYQGVYSEIAASTLPEGGKIHIFEPRPVCHPYYNKIKKKGLSRNLETKSYKIALSDKAGTATIRKDTLNNDITGKLQYAPKAVNTRTLDEVMLDENNQVPDLVKIDVEGWEYNVLLGAKRIIEMCKTHFFIEVHWEYLRYAGLKGEDVLDLFDDNLYEKDLMYFHQGKPFPPVEGVRQAKTALSYYHIYPTVKSEQ